MLGVSAGAFTSYVAAVVLGEYEFTGATPFLAGAVVGFLVAEVVLTVGRSRVWPVAVATAAVGAGGILWGAWIATASGLAPYPALAWPAAALSGAVAGVRLRPR